MIQQSEYTNKNIHRYSGWKSSDEEKRQLRIQLSIKDRAWKSQKEKAEQEAKKNNELEKRIRELEKQNQALEQELDKTRRQRDRYRDLLFKRNTQGEQAQTISPESLKSVPKRKRGGQKGHKGHGYKNPERIDHKKRVYLTHCPDCNTELNRANSLESHTIEDIPAPADLRSQVTQYEIEKQWCPCCKKNRTAKPAEVIPGTKYGINLVMYIIIQKYGSKSSLEAIVNSIEMVFGIKMSKGGIVDMLRRVKEWLGSDYDQLLSQIRGASVKHADETGWRIEGVNHWIWGFFTKTAAYYRIEESRGKGIPETVLAGSHENDVLVRDDYGGYKKLPLQHQSCWSHLLRISHEQANDKNASAEMKALHQTLKDLFKILQSTIEAPFDFAKRKERFSQCELIIDQIGQIEYQCQDAKDIQTRIRNQGTNLITALNHTDVPLTNNLAERQLRPLVVIRKMSGGSKTFNATQIHMVIMSVFESLKLKSLPVFLSLKNSILTAATG